MRPLLVLTAMLALLPKTVAAVEDRPEECFCLQHIATGQVWRGCSGYTPPDHPHAYARCFNSNDEDNIIEITETWDRVSAGETACEPCLPPPRIIDEVPLGIDEVPLGDGREDVQHLDTSDGDVNEGVTSAPEAVP